jgi:hydroxyacylglutathione hydrolase
LALDLSPRIRALTPREARAENDAGAIPVDVRDPAAFSTAHVARSINVPFSARRFADRVASVVAANAKLLLLGDDAWRVDSASSQIAASSLVLCGDVVGGPVAWMTAGFPMSQLAGISVSELRARLAAPDRRPVVVDVREPVEWEEMGYIEGALLIPLGEIATRPPDLPRNRPLAIVCEQGIRSSTAASVLLRVGFTAVANVPEGMAAWRMAGYPTVEGAPAGG